MATASIMSSMEEGDAPCHHCQSFSLQLNWSAGDVVCTNCGVVQEEHVCDTRPEWREFTEDNDLAKGLTNAARCGSLKDETKYLGGLEPTRLSKQAFGGGACPIRKTLLKINRQSDALMVKHNAKALKQAKLSRKVRQTLLERGDATETDFTDLEQDSSVRPEHDLQIVQEEEDALRSQAALTAEKWCLQRAILLHGTPEEQSEDFVEEQREELNKSLDKTCRRAACDLYRAYSMLQQACRALHLPDRVLHQATHMLTKYASFQNGITVKGVSSRVSQSVSDKETLSKLREFNKQKQAASLGSALVLLTSRNLGWSRSLQEVCSAFSSCSSDAAVVLQIKPKHCYRAVHQIKEAFPEYARSSAAAELVSNNNHVDTDRFVEHATRKLNLPPVALASVKLLVAKEQQNHGSHNNNNLATACASLTYFVCVAGDTMQRLAQLQAQQEQKRHGLIKKRKSSAILASWKKLKTEKESSSMEVKDSAVAKSTSANDSDDEKESSEHVDSGKETATGDSNKGKDVKLPFDVFSHAPVPQSATTEYEARRVWDAWTEQTPWLRSVGVVEQSCGVSRAAVMQHYEKKVFFKRMELLEFLKEASLPDTPLASILLCNICAAAPLMSHKWKD